MPASSRRRPSSGPVKGDPDHHLILNRRYWWVCCSINATPRTKEKLGFSLRTKCVETARLRRDIFLHGLHAEGLEVRLRPQHGVEIGAVQKLPAARLAVPWQQRVADVLEAALRADLPAASPPSASGARRRSVPRSAPCVRRPPSP